MVSWQSFAESAPALAGLGRERFESAGVALLGTTRKDGSPRVTPIEFQWFEGELTLGGMWQSRKMVDLDRDPRFALHSTVTNKSGTEGDFKLYGRAIPVADAGFRQRAADATFEAIGFRPTEPYHLFRLDIAEAAYVVFETAVAGARARLEGTPGLAVRMVGADANTDGYLVATWKAG